MARSFPGIRPTWIILGSVLALSLLAALALPYGAIAIPLLVLIGGGYGIVRLAARRRLLRNELPVREHGGGRRESKREFDLARKHAWHAARMHGDLVAGMSHELRAPLTAILGHAELLERSGLKPEQRDYVATVRKSAHNLLGIIDDVLIWSGLESGRAHLNEVGFNLVETVEDTLNLLAPLAFEKDLDLAYLIYRDVPLHLRGDPLRFQQILTNLVSNAIKFTDGGGVTARLMLENEDAETCTLRVSVADTGCGIDPADMDRLFDMYERLQNDGAESGSGLGLAISKRLLEMMGGYITVDSTPGKGSDFQFVLPLKKALHREQRWVPWTALQGKRVWLADDYATARIALAHHLEFWRMEVLEMDTREELRSCLDEPDLTPRPDVVIIGLRAADLDSREPLTSLLEDCRRTGLPVLALLTSIDRNLLASLEVAGATQALPKSTTRPRLYRGLCELTGVSVAGAPEDERSLDNLPTLVADNSKAARRYLAALLGGFGAGVAQAADGREALEAWRKGNFPLVLVDAEMPHMDGGAVIRAIRELAANDQRPLLIAMTADPERRDALLAAGADECLVKPFDAQGLWRTLQSHLPMLAYAPRSRRRRKDDRQPGARLAADPELSALLVEELPRQTEAIVASVRDADWQRAGAEIHTLNGTAAFYGLEDVRAAATALKERLEESDSLGEHDLKPLHAAVEAALESLGRRLETS
jgi:two-component system sensor histidine kinase BarA